MHETTIQLSEPRHVLSLLGPRDQYVRKIREICQVQVTHQEGAIRVTGEEASVAKAAAIFDRLKSFTERRGAVSPEDFQTVLAQVTGDESHLPLPAIDVVQPTREVRPRTPGQARYVEAIRKHDVVFAIGPAGTGKTYLAVALAIEALKHRQIRKIVLVRPAVEAGESLGFLPGDLLAKINPYLRPLLDALNDMMQHDEVKRYMEQDVIEVVPLAYMRGRTLNEAFIILDEAQNTTISQMKMFLTRMGEGSKIVVSGDPTQIDLSPPARSGLEDALTRLKHIEGIAVVRLSQADIVRHRLVQDIVQAYEQGRPEHGKQEHGKHEHGKHDGAPKHEHGKHEHGPRHDGRGDDGSRRKK